MNNRRRSTHKKPQPQWLTFARVTDRTKKPAANKTAATEEQPFATTREKCNLEMANGTVKGTNFPYHMVRDLPGYKERDRPGLAAVDVTNELARHLAEYAERKASPLPYSRRDISHYLWMQASRRMLAWEEIFSIVRAARKNDQVKPISYYFGYRYMIERKGTARDKKLIKFVRYVMQEGLCRGCRNEFTFAQLTLDRIKPGKAKGTYEFPNVQLMCQPCNNRKGDSYGEGFLSACPSPPSHAGKQGAQRWAFAQTDATDRDNPAPENTR